MSSAADSDALRYLHLYAKTENSLELTVDAHKQWLGNIAEHDLPNAIGAAADAQVGHQHQAVAAGRTAREVRDALDQRSGWLSRGRIIDGTDIFVFPGQGSQWVGMASALMDDSADFAGVIDRCAALIEQHSGWDLIAELRGGALTSTARVQPALLSVMVGLAELWAGFDCLPEGVIGHSQGEIAAAHFAGLLDLDSAIRLVTLRADLIHDHAPAGAMLAVDAGRAQTLDIVERTGCSLAAINAAAAVVISGTVPDIRSAEALFAEIEIETHRVEVGYPAHSSALVSIAARMADELRRAPLQPGSARTVRTYSTTHPGKPIDALDPDYWASNLVRPVEFSSAVESACDDGGRRFIEVSPHPVLHRPITADLDRIGLAARAFPTIRRNEGSLDHFVHAVVDVAATRPFAASRTGGAYPIDDLPGYAFDYDHLWIPTPGVADNIGSAMGANEQSFEIALDLDSVADHVIADRVIVAAVHIVAMTMAGLATRGVIRLDDLCVLDPWLPEGDDDALRGIAEEGSLVLQSGSGRELGRATPSPLRAADRAVSPPIPDSRSGDECVTGDDMYARLAAAGYAYGPTFRTVLSYSVIGDSVVVDVQMPADHAAGLPFSPAGVDGALHAFIDHTLGRQGGAAAMVVPFTFEDIVVDTDVVVGPTARFVVVETAPLTATIEGYGADGEHFLTIGALRFSEFSPPPSGDLLRKTWEPIASPAAVGSSVPSTGDTSILPSTSVMPFDRWLATPGPRVYVMGSADENDPLALASETLGIIRAILDSPVVTRSSVVLPHRPQFGAAIGMLRTAFREHPDRFQIIHRSDGSAIAAVYAAARHPADEILVDGVGLHVPRYVPDDEPAPSNHPTPPFGNNLAPNEIEVANYYGGLNFRDVVIDLGMVDGESGVGIEFAGIVTDTGSAVDTLRPGDRVMGILSGGALAPVLRMPAERATVVPRNWSMQLAAAVPIVYVTALQCLAGIARIRPGMKVLIHAGAGGVGMAAIQIARHLGAEVYTTASSDKRGAVHAAGVPWERIADSRSTSFVEQFESLLGKRPFDCVLNSLTGDKITAGASLLARDGAFVEIGKTDVRPDIAEKYGVDFHHYNLMALDTTEIATALRDLVNHFTTFGDRPSLQVSVAPLARFDRTVAKFKDGATIGKHIFSTRPLIGPGTRVLVTGGAGGIGRRVSAHIAHTYGPAAICCVSRSAATNSPETVAGSTIEYVGCDVGDYDSLSDVFSDFRPDVVLHAAGVLADGTLEMMGSSMLSTVFASKAIPAVHLSELCDRHGVTACVHFSSISGVVGELGQANYAGANTYLDSVCDEHRADTAGGQSSYYSRISIAWGVWKEASGMTGHLRDSDFKRMEDAGLQPLSNAEALALFDRVVASPTDRCVAAVKFAADTTMLPDILSTTRGGSEPRVDHGHRTETVVDTPTTTESPEPDLLEKISVTAAQILDRKALMAADEQFRDAGFDSLTSLELRNDLTKFLGRKLPPGIVFDNPTPRLLAAALTGGAPTERVVSALPEMR
ncbi:SDR family NAD(P)-dependent oxidoreductase [Antrihabitans cavernicola]|uniref:SDR family NAD(P)-dependent oxidoreductase n=1 Tax=Antrihabitans cavernicola TaxID=2495913 RepID=A0A5A7S861_9NOCA|nr:SDR family NAD(P)-dependent oxidoreductase [Spelaeibacter cavernicola]KAA0021664.1 SDR family NAD(P)-dependent oxidoreductase [Spelaeibacter cavernicola]